MSKVKIRKIVICCIALVWLVNGLFCKVLNLVPRHEQIAAGILGTTYSREITIFIGFMEIGMTVLILSRFWSRLNTIIQMISGKCLIATP